MSSARSPADAGNYLLDQLPRQEFERLAPDLVPVDLGLQQVVHPFEG